MLSILHHSSEPVVMRPCCLHILLCKSKNFNQVLKSSAIWFHLSNPDFHDYSHTGRPLTMSCIYSLVPVVANDLPLHFCLMKSLRPNLNATSSMRLAQFSPARKNLPALSFYGYLYIHFCLALALFGSISAARSGALVRYIVSILSILCNRTQQRVPHECVCLTHGRCSDKCP